jgi:transposase-like protein
MAIPESFRRDLVAMARRREAPLRTIAEDFGVSEDWPYRRIDRSTPKMTVEVGLSVALRQLIRTAMRSDRGSQFHSKGLARWKESELQDRYDASACVPMAPRWNPSFLCCG